jgi:hypothetical protein
MFTKHATVSNISHTPHTLLIMSWKIKLRPQLLAILFFAALTTVCAEAAAELTLSDISKDQVEEQIQVRTPIVHRYHILT